MDGAARVRGVHSAPPSRIEQDRAVGLLPAGDAQSAGAGFAFRFPHAIRLEQAAIADAGLAFDVAVPPVGGQPVAAVVFRRRIDRDVVRAVQLDRVRALALRAGVSAARDPGEEFQAEVGAGLAQGVEVAHLGLDGREVGHDMSWVEICLWVLGLCRALEMKTPAGARGRRASGERGCLMGRGEWLRPTMGGE